MSEFRSRWLVESPETTESRSAKSPSGTFGTATSKHSSENMPAPDTCACGRRLALPESQEWGKRADCQTESEFNLTLARLRIRRESRTQGVAAFAEQLKLGEE